MEKEKGILPKRGSMSLARVSIPVPAGGNFELDHTQADRSLRKRTEALSAQTEFPIVGGRKRSIFTRMWQKVSKPSVGKTMRF